MAFALGMLHVHQKKQSWCSNYIQVSTKNIKTIDMLMFQLPGGFSFVLILCVCLCVCYRSVYPQVGPKNPVRHHCSASRARSAGGFVQTPSWQKELQRGMSRRILPGALHSPQDPLEKSHRVGPMKRVEVGDLNFKSNGLMVEHGSRCRWYNAAGWATCDGCGWQDSCWP